MEAKVRRCVDQFGLLNWWNGGAQARVPLVLCLPHGPGGGGTARVDVTVCLPCLDECGELH